MKKRLICIFLAVLMLITALSIRVSQYYSIACDTYAQEGIKGSITKNINETLANKLAEENIGYENVAKINYHSDGRISSISIDTAKINLLTAELSNDIYNCIENSSNRYGIPFGNILGDKYLSGKGPEIGVTIITVGAVVYEIQSELISGGLNQTLHRISIRFDTVINCIAPFHESKCSINTTVILAETLIVGEIPNVMLSTWG